MKSPRPVADAVRPIFAGVLLALPAALPAPVPDAAVHAQPRTSSAQVRALEITILSTMLADEGIGEWGFAALVEADGRKILFDTGALPDTVLRNAASLGLDLGDAGIAVLSHNHGDHTGGLVPLRRELSARSPGALARTFVGRGIFWPRTGADGSPVEGIAEVRREYEAAGGTFVEIDAPTEILPGVWLTGPVPRVHPERNWSTVGRVRTDEGLVEDTIPEDITLVADTAEGLVALFGCGHAGVINTLDHVRSAISPAPFHTVIGGLHLFNNDDAGLAWTAARMKDLGVRQLVGAHCTGLEAVYRIRDRAGLSRRTCVVGAVGASFSLEHGIDPLRLAR